MEANGFSAILHRRPSVRFDSDGITIRRLLFPVVSIPWHEIKSISPTPQYEQAEGTWAPGATPDDLSSSRQDAAQKLVNSGDLELQLLASARFVPMWMLFPLGPVFAKPLYDAGGQLDPSRRVVFLKLNTARLSGPVTELFNLLSEHCRFDLIVTE